MQLDDEVGRASDDPRVEEEFLADRELKFPFRPELENALVDDGRDVSVYQL
jgi:hypothetical protein